MKLKFILYAISLYLLMMIEDAVQAQDYIHYSQYMNNELRINPAFSGMHQAFSFAIAGRSQWSGVSGSPTFFSFTSHTPFNEKIAGGIVVASRNFGVINNVLLTGQFAYQLKLSKQKTLNLGINFGTNIQRFGFSYANDIKDANDPLIGNIGTRTGVITGGGMYYKSSKLEIGLSAPELFNPNFQNEFNVLQVLYLYSRYKYRINYNWILAPSLFLQNDFVNNDILYNLNVAMSYNEVLYLNVGLKNLKDIMVMTRIRVTNQLVMGYSVDVPVQTSNRINVVSHEIMINYILLLKNQHSVWKEIGI